MARRELLDWRHKLSPEVRVEAEQRIVRTIETWLNTLSQPDAVLGGYWAMRGEPQLLTAYRRWHDAGRVIVLPRVVAPDAPLQFGRWLPDGAMRQARFKVMEPEPFEVLAPGLLLIPCVGFDEQGFRLGYGGGFYDRTLQATPMPSLGVAFEGCRVEGFTPQPHDRRLDAVASEVSLRTWHP